MSARLSDVITTHKGGVTVPRIDPPLTEEKILESLKAEGITNLSELAAKSVEDANKKNKADEPNYFYSGVHYSWYHPE